MNGSGVAAALRRGARCLVGAWLLVALGACSGRTEHGAGPSAAAPPASELAKAEGGSRSAEPEGQHHRLLVVELTPATNAARVLLARSVDLPLPRRRGPVRAEPWRVELLSADGALLFSAPLADATERRGEFADPKTGELRGVSTHLPVAAVTLRLPELAGAKQVRIVDAAHGDLELGRFAYPQVAP